MTSCHLTVIPVLRALGPPCIAAPTHPAPLPRPASCSRYDNVEMALNCGSMFRDCVRDKTLAA